MLGSIPSAYLAGYLLKGKDIRQMGHGNSGAANAFRELGSKTGIVVGLVDAGKGALAIIITQALNAPQPVVMATGVMAVIGHNWPIYLAFRGGRGESVTIGVMLPLITLPMLIMTVPAILTLVIFKNVILASAVLFIPLPLVCWWLGFSGIEISYVITLPCLVGFTHFLRTRRGVVPQV